jgi:hypothetical protein
MTQADSELSQASEGTDSLAGYLGDEQIVMSAGKQRSGILRASGYLDPSPELGPSSIGSHSVHRFSILEVSAVLCLLSLSITCNTCFKLDIRAIRRWCIILR